MVEQGEKSAVENVGTDDSRGWTDLKIPFAAGMGRRQKTVLLLFGTGVLLLLLFCCFLYRMEGRLRPAVPGGTESDSVVYWEVERLYYDEDTHYYTIEGWAFVPAEEIDTYACQILLQNEQTGQLVELPGIMVDRSDLETRMPECEDSFQAMEHCGFRSIFSRDKLPGGLEQYVIYLEYQNNGHDILINTQRRLNQF